MSFLIFHNFSFVIETAETTKSMNKTSFEIGTSTVVLMSGRLLLKLLQQSIKHQVLSSFYSW